MMDFITARFEFLSSVISVFFPFSFPFFPFTAQAAKSEMTSCRREAEAGPTRPCRRTRHQWQQEDPSTEENSTGSMNEGFLAAFKLNSTYELEVSLTLRCQLLLRRPTSFGPLHARMLGQGQWPAGMAYCACKHTQVTRARVEHSLHSYGLPLKEDAAFWPERCDQELKVCWKKARAAVLITCLNLKPIMGLKSPE